MADTRIYKVLIVDDEPHARDLLRRIVERDVDCRVVDECGNGECAIQAIHREEPDIVLLDVQMPGIDGFGVVTRVGAANMPVVIFVTAWDEYAVRAFEVHALDYILKPFDDDRLEASLARAKAIIAQSRMGDLATRLSEMLSEARNLGAAPGQPHKPSEALERLAVKVGDRIHIVSVDDVDWIEATGNYARLHVGGETYSIRSSMQELEARLPETRFVRIHRSTLVNLDRVRELQEYFRGEYIVLLRDGTKLKLSRARRSRLEEVLGQSF